MGFTPQTGARDGTFQKAMNGAGSMAANGDDDGADGAAAVAREAALGSAKGCVSEERANRRQLPKKVSVFNTSASDKQVIHRKAGRSASARCGIHAP